MKHLDRSLIERKHLFIDQNDFLDYINQIEKSKRLILSKMLKICISRTNMAAEANVGGQSRNFRTFLNRNIDRSDRTPYQKDCAHEKIEKIDLFDLIGLNTLKYRNRKSNKSTFLVNRSNMTIPNK